jgi:hypothetical protein
MAQQWRKLVDSRRGWKRLNLYKGGRKEYRTFLKRIAKTKQIRQIRLYIARTRGGGQKGCILLWHVMLYFFKRMEKCIHKNTI